jgi:3-methyladenine DNA glycosylase/8-oxoguanine DNA glycosylase
VTSLRIGAVGPLDVPFALGVLAAHAIPGAEVSSPADRSHTRLIRTGTGTVPVTVTFGEEVDAHATADGPAVLAEITAVIRRWLDLDTDIRVVGTALGADPVLGPLVRARPGVRLIGFPDEFEGVVMTVLGQQVSLAAARTFGGRLTAAYGTPAGAGLLAFPDPCRLAAVPAHELRAAVGLTTARAMTVHALARAWQAGFTLDGQHPAQARRRLLELPGIGPWTADYLTVRALRDPDTFAAGDLVVRRALGNVTTAQARTLSARWSPWRSYALFHLWAAAVYS